MQEGLPTGPQMYWLAVEVEAVDGQFGWSTRQWPEHFGGDAVWARGRSCRWTWDETFYPHGHAYYDIERQFRGYGLLPAVPVGERSAAHVPADGGHPVSGG